MPAIRECDEHGYFLGGACPDCETRGRKVLSGDRREQLSKFVSGSLRHFPDDSGIDLGEHGWTSYDRLVDVVTDEYGWARPEHVAAVVTTDPKGRFERDGDRIRASYGHSVGVTLEVEDTPVPETLFHGTPPSNLDSIAEEGLRPMNRQKVHLSGTIDEAVSVGRRHADDPVVLAIDADAMLADDYRIVKRGREVYTTDHVPPRYLEAIEEDVAFDPAGRE